MNASLSEAIILGGQMERIAELVKHIDIVIAPPSVFIYPIYERLRAKPKNFYFGLQDTAWEDAGSFTGEVSLSMVRGVCRFVIVGHSERRMIFGETDETVNRKVLFSLSRGLNTVVCVGEQERFHLEDHYQAELKRMKSGDGVLTQIKKALSGISKADLDKVIIAYEPIWAIGTANAANGAYAAAVSHIIKEYLYSVFDEASKAVRVLYGGSVSSTNVKEFMMQPSIDGLLVGGASLKSSEFAKICKISSETKSGQLI